jgi:uncharacterized protein (DUF697 family)
MRIDQRAAAAFKDGEDLRGLLLGATGGELRRLRTLAAIGDEADIERLAEAIGALMAKELGRREEGLAALSSWAAGRLADLSPSRSLEEADAVLARIAPDAVSEVSREPARPQLLQIALAISHLRHRKLRRLRFWQPLLDRVIGAQETAEQPARTPTPPVPAPPAPVDEAEAPANEADRALDENAMWDMIKAAGSRLPLSLWEERLTEARKAVGRFNIIVAGRTGVGKTTLIGAIFGEEVGNTLMGRPRTRGRIWYPLEPTEADVLRLCDTEGLELERYEETLGGLQREVESRNASNDAFEHIHVAWLCIDEPSLTVQPGEEALVQTLNRAGIPVIAVLTKAGMAPAFKDTVEKLLPDAKAVIRVRAAPIEIEGQIFPRMGLDALMEATEQAIPNAVSAAWHIASRNLAANLKRCETLVKRAAAAAGAAGAAPIPLADAAGVFGVQVGMIIAISLNMGIKLRRSDLQAMAVTLLGALGLTAGGRFLAGQVAKLIPGLGSIAGSAITGTTAAALTYGLGRAYLEYLRGFFEKHQRMPDNDELVVGFRTYWRQWKNKYDAPPPSGSS